MGARNYTLLAMHALAFASVVFAMIDVAEAASAAGVIVKPLKWVGHLHAPSRAA